MPDPTQALYVRLPHAESQRLQRAAAALGTNKKALVSSLVAAYVDPDTPEGLEQLRSVSGDRRVTVSLPEEGVTVGRHSEFPGAGPLEPIIIQASAGTVEEATAQDEPVEAGLRHSCFHRADCGDGRTGDRRLIDRMER